MSNKAIKELNKRKTSIENEIGQVVALHTVQQLLLEAHSEEEQVLEAIGLVNYGNYQKELTAKLGRTKKMEEIYSRPVFTGTMVRDLCQTYYLKVLPAKYFVGEMATDVPRKITEFCKENNITAKSNNFYIMAPSEMFNTDKKKLPAKPPKNVDPILFYVDKDRTSTNDNTISLDDELVQVANWGKDFTEIRKFKHLFSGYLKENEDISMKTSTTVAIGLALVALIVGLVFSISYISFGILTISMIIMLKNSTGTKKIDEAWNEPVH